MRLGEQRDRLIDGVVDASTYVKYMRTAIQRKIAAPYGDGSRSNMVNAETDVLPTLNAILDTLETTLEAINRGPDAEAKREAQSVRVW